jgi:hypothetical protein
MKGRGWATGEFHATRIWGLKIFKIKQISSWTDSAFHSRRKPAPSLPNYDPPSISEHPTAIDSSSPFPWPDRKTTHPPSSLSTQHRSIKLLNSSSSNPHSSLSDPSNLTPPLPPHQSSLPPHAHPLQFSAHESPRVDTKHFTNHFSTKIPLSINVHDNQHPTIITTQLNVCNFRHEIYVSLHSAYH